MGAGKLAAVLRRVLLVAERQAQGQGDRQLLDLFVAKRDEAAFAALVERHGRLVFGVCRSVLHNEHDAEDAFQATFLVLARMASSIRQRDSLASWLYGVALRTAMKARRAMTTRRRHEREASPQAPTPPVAEAAERELEVILCEEIGRLPEKYRTPLVLCVLQGKSRADAAQELGWKEGTVSSRIAKARALLEASLTRRGLAVVPAVVSAAVPVALAASVARAAAPFAAKKACETVSVAAVALAEVIIQGMLTAKVKAIAGLVLLLMTVLGGGGLLAYSAIPNDKPAAAIAVRLPDGRTLKSIDFERHVHALLDRQGCNAGKCHGNRDGKGGFSLSLFAASPESDFLEIARRSNGRQVNVADPERSLFLLKATGKLQHGGDMRVAPGSWEYELLREWIAQGARRGAGHGKIKSLKVVPHDHIFQNGDQVNLHVIAEFADGAKEDVTPFCDFRMPPKEDKKAGDPVRVSPTGTVVAVKPGDVSISVVYRGQVRTMRARVVVPVAKDFVYPKVPEVNFIDREVFGQLRRLNIVPSDLCSDEQFLRRVNIDLIGTIPTPAEVRAFVASKDHDKRTKKIDELLAHPLHAALLALRFCEMTDLVGASDGAKAPRNKATQMAHGWFRKRLQENMPYDQIVAGVLTATSREGRSMNDWLKEKAALEKADTGFGGDYAMRATLDIYWRDSGVVRQKDPIFGSWAGMRRPTEEVDALYLEEIAERTASAFLGVNLECARCHVHPLEGWTPADHRAFTNVFGQVRLEKVERKSGTLEKWEQSALAREVFLSEAPLQLRQTDLQDRTFLAAVSNRGIADVAAGAVLKPRLLNGSEVDFQSDARQALVRWLIDPENPFFARHFVDMTWQHYFGVSLENSNDRLTSVHRSGNHPLLDQLAREFIESKFDIRRLERTILLSRAYQLSSVPNESNKHDRTNFARTVPRRHGARVLTEILHVVLETREDYGPGVPVGINTQEIAHVASAFYRQGYDTDYRKRIARMVHQFGRGDLVARCDNEPDLRSYLMLYGSNELHRLIEKSKRIERLRKSDEQQFDAILDEVFLAALSRLPTPDIRKAATEHLKRDWPKNRRSVVENLVWWLVNTDEFTARY